MQKYRRVAYEDRCHISALLQANCSVKEITTLLGFSKTTIYREIARNSIKGVYNSERALIMASKRFRRCRRKKIINHRVDAAIKVYIDYGWSPEQIARRFKLEKAFSISHQTIYRKYKNCRVTKRKFRKRRRSGGRQSQRVKRLQTRLSIHERPSIVEQRKRIGDWERDGIYGANRKQLLVLTERKTRYTKLIKIGTGPSKLVSEATLNAFKRLNKKVYTITNDNGTEFSDFASMPYRTYFCDPHKPQQRGTVENTIGLLRQYIKRKTDLDRLTDEDLLKIEQKINFRPRKCLDYRTPFEVFFKKKVALAMLI